jgi:hypothetical protein
MRMKSAPCWETPKGARFVSIRPPRQAPQTASDLALETRRVAGDLEAAIREILPRHGIAGTVVVRGSQAELHQASGTPISVDVGWVIEQWALLPADMRERKALDVARRLADAHHKATGTGPSAPSDGGRRTWMLVIGGAVLVLGGLAAAFLLRAPKETPGESPEAIASAEASARAAASRTTCESERANLFAGRPFGQFGLEGWVLELWLASRSGSDLVASPALSALVAGEKLAATGDPALDGLAPAVQLLPGFAESELPSMKGYSAAILRFSGSFVYQALTQGEVRDRLVVLSEGVAQKSGASMAALVGRCAHLKYRDVGVWFRGAEKTEAISALFYTVGGFAEAPTLDYAKATALSTSSSLDGLLVAAGRVDAAALNAAVTPSNGTVKVDAATKAVSITFPLLGYTTALKATGELASKAGVAR